MRKALLVLSLTASCATGGARESRAACAVPVTNDVLGMPVYGACAVDRQARLVPGSPGRMQYTPSRNLTCLRAIIDVVVNAEGVPIPSTATIVRTNDQGFATAAVTSLAQARYTPAQKGGQAVAQVVRFEPVVVLVRTTGAPPTNAQARSASRSC